jgi:DNA helicase HerA-like ATPase
MADIHKMLIAKGDTELYLLPKMANRHGLIAGATGTGKTITLQVMAEAFSSIGVPVFLADVKGDLSGTCIPGENKAKINERVKSLGLNDFEYKGFPVTFWDVFGQQGHPVRTTISEMGPLLLSRLLDLNETQGGILNVVFRVADEMGMLLIDLKDLKAMLKYVADNSKEITTEYGNISKQSVGAIQRRLLILEEQGAEKFFGEPALNIMDLIKTDINGMGFINILASDQLFNFPAVYSTFLLWLLSELFEKLPEVGDPEKPRIIFFFDEAHLLFDEVPKFLLQKIEQVVRLIRSKGVGVYFITQNPIDIPTQVLGQLGNRVQHALRAFTPRDQKAAKSAAETFRLNPKFDITQVITELGVGEALVSFLDREGRPSVVERALVIPPSSYIGSITQEKREEVIKSSYFYGRYEDTFDRISAYEKLQDKKMREELEASRASTKTDNYQRQKDYEKPTQGKRNTGTTNKRKRTTDTPMEKMAKSAMSSIGREVGRELIRGILGSLTKK